MTQPQLDRAVAAVTGESRRFVRRFGFSLADPIDIDFDPEPEVIDRFIDWDELVAERFSQLALF